MKKNLYLFQPQYSVVHTEKEIYSNYWIPYSVGCIWSYVSQFKEITDNFELKDLIYKREHIGDLVERLEDPFICGFSSYVWNEAYCYTAARRIKERYPNCLIVFGGPNTESHELDGVVDIIVEAEGELSFHKLLTQVLNGEEPDKRFKPERIQTLEFPSPYTSGVFDKIFENNPTATWNMTIETNRGCPFKCTYCNWGMVTMSKIKKFGLERVAADLEWAANNRVEYITCADANFGIFKERDMEIAKLIRETCDKGLADHVNLQYTKNSTETVFEIAKIIGPYSKGITVSVQSMHDDTLVAIKRKNLGVNDMKHIMALSRKYGVNTYSEFILGLPEETLESWKDGLCEIIELGQHDSIDVWFGQLLEGSEMASFESLVKYGLKHVKAYDFMNFVDNENNEENIVNETMKIVNKTNTQTTDEMVEGFMYGWMITTFHIGGYSQVYTRYLHSIKNIRIRNFYDSLFDKVRNGFYKEHYDELYKKIYDYLHYGKMSSSQSGHGMHYSSLVFALENRDETLKICQEVFDELCDDKEVHTVQSAFIYDENVDYPIQIETDFDLIEYKPQKKIYKVESKIKKNKGWESFRYRRKGVQKNNLIEI